MGLIYDSLWGCYVLDLTNEKKANDADKPLEQKKTSVRKFVNEEGVTKYIVDTPDGEVEADSFDEACEWVGLYSLQELNACLKDSNLCK